MIPARQILFPLNQFRIHSSWQEQMSSLNSWGLHLIFSWCWLRLSCLSLCLAFFSRECHDFYSTTPSPFTFWRSSKRKLIEMACALVAALILTTRWDSSPSASVDPELMSIRYKLKMNKHNFLQHAHHGWELFLMRWLESSFYLYLHDRSHNHHGGENLSN